MKAETKKDEDKLDLIGLRIDEIRIVADLLTDLLDKDGALAGGAMLIRRLADEAHDVLLAAIEEINAELQQTKGAAA